MRRVGDQPAVGVEERAGEIEPLLDVHGIGGVLQRHAHLLGDRHEEIVEHLEHDRVALGAHREGPLERDNAGENQVALRREFGLPAGLDDGRGGLLADDGGAGDAVAGHEHVPVIDRRLVLFSLHMGVHQSKARHVVGCRPLAPVRLLRLRHHADAFDRGGFDDQPLLRHDEAIVPVVRGLEAGRHLRRRPELDRVRGVAPLVADVGAANHLDPFVGNVLFREFRLDLDGEIVERRRKLRRQRIVEGRFDRLLP